MSSNAIFKVINGKFTVIDKNQEKYDCNLAKLPKKCDKHNKTLKCMVSEVCYSAYECRANSKDYCMFEVVPEKIELWEIDRKRL